MKMLLGRNGKKRKFLKFLFGYVLCSTHVDRILLYNIQSNSFSAAAVIAGASCQLAK
jgi:hypothetical protein